MFTDSISKKDLLGRKEFAQHVANGLFKSSEIETSGFVTALTGKWGVGKSTLLSFVEEELNSLCLGNNNYKFIRFNPWMFADAVDIKLIFLKTLAENLCVNKSDELKEHWGKWISKIIRFATSIFSFSKEPGKIISELIETYSKKNFIQFKIKIDEILIKNNFKIFVFFDDIDRLFPKQVFEILQILKLTCNFKNTYYIIAYDREAVEISIESQFKNYGKKFLDKIVQADFLIPEAPLEKVESIFFTEVENIRKDFNIDVDTSALSSIWLHRGLKGYFTTLRNVYRYFNSIRFSLPAIAKEVDINDFLVLESIRIYDYENYIKIYDDYSFKIFSFGKGIEFGTEIYLETIENRITRQLMGFLFPTNRGFFKKPDKRLNNSEYFFRYFTLQLASKDVAEFELEKIIFDEQRRIELLKTIVNQNRIQNLLIRLNDESINSKYTWDFKLIYDIYYFFNAYAEKLADFADRISDSIINLMSSKNKEKILYFDYFLNLLTEETNKVEYGRIYFLHYIILSKLRDTGFPNKSEFKEAYLLKYDKLKEFYLTYLREWQSYFLNNDIPNPLSFYTTIFIYDYAYHIPMDYNQRLDSILSKSANLLFFIKNILSISSNSEAFRIDGERMDIFLPNQYKDIFFKKLEDMDVFKLTEIQKQWRDFLINYYRENSL